MILSKMMMYFDGVAECNHLPKSHPDYAKVTDFCFWFLNNEACISEVIKPSGMYHQMITADDDKNQDLDGLIEDGATDIFDSICDCTQSFSNEADAVPYIVEDMIWKHQFLIVEVIASCVFHYHHEEFVYPSQEGISPSGSGCVYIWEDNAGAYKIGITKWTNREARPKRCASSRGSSVVRCIYGKVEQARPHESALLNFGSKCYTDGDGYTEFRRLNKHELDACICYINSVSIEVDDSNWV